jgi:hypothetical protein
VGLGHPVYNNCRSDIGTQFPGYANSSGAMGYYYLNTTGIGSRCFTVLNTGGGTVAGQALPDKAGTGGGAFQRPGDNGLSGRPRTLDEVLTLPLRFGALTVFYQNFNGKGEQGKHIGARGILG